jgi:hypothetical protein
LPCASAAYSRHNHETRHFLLIRDCLEKIGLVFFGAFSAFEASYPKDAFPILIYPRASLPSNLPRWLEFHTAFFLIEPRSNSARFFRMVTFMGQNQGVRLGNQAGALRLRQKPYD